MHAHYYTAVVVGIVPWAPTDIFPGGGKTMVMVKFFSKSLKNVKQEIENMGIFIKVF
jgi:hypothetical protein